MQSELSINNKPSLDITHSQTERIGLQLTRSATRDDGELRDRSALVPGVSNNTKLVLSVPPSPHSQSKADLCAASYSSWAEINTETSRAREDQGLLWRTGHCW